MVSRPAARASRLLFVAALVAALVGAIVGLADVAAGGVPHGRGNADDRRVGVRTFRFVDRDRRTPADPSAGITPSTSRSLPTTVYYPARGAAPPDDAPVPDARPAAGRHPLVLFGAGSPGTPDDYASLLAEWAAHGYVVAAPQFPVSALAGPDDVARRDLPKQSGDVRFVLDKVLGLDPRRVGIPELDDERIAVVGHSFGGATALSLVSRCCRDERIDASVALATVTTTDHGPPLRGLQGPVLFVHARRDPAVSYASALRTCKAAASPKRMITVEGLRGDRAHVVPFVGRDDPSSDVVRPAILDFLDGHVRDQRAARRRLDDRGVGSNVATVSRCRPGRDPGA